MLNRLDDYPIHQTPVPVAHAATSDPNFYDRYFFNGYTRDGGLFFAAALGVYPNRRVMDAAFSVVRDGQQTVVQASRLAPGERTETAVGPIRVEVEDPMRVLCVTLEENEHGISAELRFTARADAIEEARVLREFEGRRVMDSTRFTQFGTWSGELCVDGQRIEVDDDTVLGCRDRSWGVRPVGERAPAAAPGPPPQIYWVWAPLHFDDLCTLYGTFEDSEGHAWHHHAARAVPWASQVDASPDREAGVETVRGVSHEIVFAPGTRRSQSARLGHADGTIELTPLLTFQMLGLGYLSPDWGHGMWKGEEAVSGERWKLADLDPLDPRHIHVQQLVKARMGEREGIGVLEQLIIGPHAPSGFVGLLDGAKG
ncbi:MAG: hypothetical protein HKP30_06475 [Myxococcales bacterium]|nr:hypothetical protein [Myxococcales bacterium]